VEWERYRWTKPGDLPRRAVSTRSRSVALSERTKILQQLHARLLRVFPGLCATEASETHHDECEHYHLVRDNSRFLARHGILSPVPSSTLRAQRRAVLGPVVTKLVEHVLDPSSVVTIGDLIGRVREVLKSAGADLPACFPGKGQARLTSSQLGSLIRSTSPFSACTKDDKKQARFLGLRLSSAPASTFVPLLVHDPPPSSPSNSTASHSSSSLAAAAPPAGRSLGALSPEPDVLAANEGKFEGLHQDRAASRVPFSAEIPALEQVDLQRLFQMSQRGLQVVETESASLRQQQATVEAEIRQLESGLLAKRRELHRISNTLRDHHNILEQHKALRARFPGF
jgi:hypothetical protein